MRTDLVPCVHNVGTVMPAARANQQLLHQPYLAVWLQLNSHTLMHDMEVPQSSPKDAHLREVPQQLNAGTSTNSGRAVLFCGRLRRQPVVIMWEDRLLVTHHPRTAAIKSKLRYLQLLKRPASLAGP